MNKSMLKKNLSSIIFIFLMLLGSVVRADLTEFRSALMAEGLTEQESSSVISKLGGSYSEDTVRSKIAWLRAHGVQDIGKVLSLFPSLLGLSISENLDPKVAWLRAQGVQDIGKFLSLFPPFLGLSISENLNPKVAWLRAQGVQDMGKMLSGHPSVLGRSISENLNPKVTWLRAQGIQDISKVVTQFPNIWGYSIPNNLQPTVEEFYKYWGLSAADFEASPMIFGASLSRVVRLRQFLDQWAQVAGDQHFNLGRISVAKRISMIQGVSVESVLENLMTVGAIRSDIRDFSKLNKGELELMISLYKTGQMEGLLVRPKLLPKGTRGSVSSFCQSALSSEI